MEYAIIAFSGSVFIAVGLLAGAIVILGKGRTRLEALSDLIKNAGDEAKHEMWEEVKFGVPVRSKNEREI